MDYKAGLDFAREKHRGQYRKHGAPYIDHPKAVVDLLRSKGIEDQEILLAGLFHDLLEDTDARDQEILDLASPRVLELVKILSKGEDFKMEDYVARIQADPDARLIKLADRLANLQDSFNLGPAYGDFLQAYMENTQDYYVDLAKSSPFQEDLDQVMAKLEEFLPSLRPGN